MRSDDENFQQRTGILASLREQIRTLDAKIVDEEASLGDWKRVKAKEWMGVLFGGLLECGAKGAVVATSGGAVIECVSTDTTQPGFPRVRYSGYSRVNILVAEAEQTLREISSASEAGISFINEADISFITEDGDETLQLPSELHTGGVPENPPSAPTSLIQPTPTQPIQPHASPTLLNDPLRSPDELGDFGDPRPQTPTQRTGISSFDQSSPASPNASSPPTLFPLQRGPGFTPGRQPGLSAERELHRVSFISEIGGGSLQLPNGTPIDDTPGFQLFLPDSYDQPVPTTPSPPPYALSAHSNPFGDLHELSDPGEYYDPHPQPRARAPAQQTRLSPSEEPSPVNPARSSSFTPFPPPGPPDFTLDTPGLPSSPSTSQIRPTPTFRLAQKLAAAERRIKLDAELAKYLQAVEDDGETYADAPEVQDVDRRVATRPLFPRRDLDPRFTVYLTW